MNTTRSLLRSREGHARVTYVELFFDLVFVFAVTQLSHSLVEAPDLAGALQTLFLLLAVWWVWMYTCWFTNWVDPDKPAPRVMMFLLMFAGLLLSASIPNAFDDEALLFASAYVFSQVVALGVHAVRDARTRPAQLTAISSASPAGRWSRACSGSGAVGRVATRR